MFPRAAVGILGLLLAGMASVAVVGAMRVKSAKHARVASDISVFHSRLEEYRQANGSFPTTEQGLQALVRAPTGLPRPAQWPPVLEYIPPDPWNASYLYRCPGTKNPGGYDLFSAGPDRRRDTADDDWGGK